jgi:lipoyl(octanoyl) transferase
MDEGAIRIEHKGITDYSLMWQEMKHYTEHRDDQSPDVCWLTQHPAVYTLGLNIKSENRPAVGEHHSGDLIPCVETDRGGQITYHGLGQFIVYVLVDLRRRHLAVKEMVAALERGTLGFLADVGIAAHLKNGAPGVYVEGAKIASLGLKIRRGCTYHGLSLNAEMDLTPFHHIHPCGYEGLHVTQLSECGIEQANRLELHEALAVRLIQSVDTAAKRKI